QHSILVSSQIQFSVSNSPASKNLLHADHRQTARTTQSLPPSILQTTPPVFLLKCSRIPPDPHYSIPHTSYPRTASGLSSDTLLAAAAHAGTDGRNQDSEGSVSHRLVPRAHSPD